MTQPTVRVVGADRLERTLRRAGDDVTDQAELNARTASSMARAMAGRAPRRTGLLAMSVVPSSSAEYAAASTSLLHGAVQEYGSRVNNTRPQPFARPTFADQAPRYVEDLGDKLQHDLDRVQGA
jgi:hypothetical protein